MDCPVFPKINPMTLKHKQSFDEHRCSLVAINRNINICFDVVAQKQKLETIGGQGKMLCVTLWSVHIPVY